MFAGNHDRVSLTFPSPYLMHFPSPVVIQGGEGELAWEKCITVSHEEAFHRELRIFCDNIRTGAEPMTCVSEALKHIRFIQQIIDVIKNKKI